jgi:hypothetical protein
MYINIIYIISYTCCSSQAALPQLLALASHSPGLDPAVLEMARAKVRLQEISVMALNNGKSTKTMGKLWEIIHRWMFWWESHLL